MKERMPRRLSLVVLSAIVAGCGDEADCPPSYDREEYFRHEAAETCFVFSKESSCGYFWTSEFTAVPCEDVPGFVNAARTEEFRKRITFGRRPDGSCAAFYQAAPETKAQVALVDCGKVGHLID